jgi:hypothetical protein
MVKGGKLVLVSGLGIDPLGKALEEQRNGEWRYLKFLQVTGLIMTDIFMREIPRWDESQASVLPG